MKKKKNQSIEKQIERLQKQIIKFGDPTGTKKQIIQDLRQGDTNDQKE